MNRFLFVTFIVMTATTTFLFAQSSKTQTTKTKGTKSQAAKTQDTKKEYEKCKFLECPLGTKTAEERNDYKEATKEVKQIEKQVQKQEQTTQEACTPSAKKTVKALLDPFQAGRDMSNGREIGASQCDRENEKLNALRKQDAEAERIAQEKKAAYEKAKKETGSWR